MTKLEQIAYDKADRCFSSQLPHRCVYFINYFVGIDIELQFLVYSLMLVGNYLQTNEPSIAKKHIIKKETEVIMPIN